MVLKIDEIRWNDSQKNEKYFWESQFRIGNIDQFNRNAYYQSVMEGVCPYIRDFLYSHNLEDKVLLDIGSGPEGILHKLEAKEKHALDPLMEEYENMGYDIHTNEVITNKGSSEEKISIYINKFDIVFCLNALDHFFNIDTSIKNIYSYLKDKGSLVLLTDLRTENQLDCFHKMPVSDVEILSVLKNNNFIVDRQMIFNHGAGNPIKQWCAICQK